MYFIWNLFIFVFLVVSISAVLTGARILRDLNRKRRRLVKMLEKLPHSKGHFIFGNRFELTGPRNEMFKKGRRFMKQFDEYPLVCFWLGPLTAAVTFTKAETVEILLGTNHSLEKSERYKFLHPWLGLGLLTSGGEKWHRRRKILTPSFHFKILDEFVDVFNKQSRIFVRKLESHADDGKQFDIYPLVSLCTLDIICETAMQKSINAQSDSKSAYVTAVNVLTDILSKRFMSMFFGSDWVFSLTSGGRRQRKTLEIAHSFTDKVIAERRQEHSQLMKLTPNNISGTEEVFGRKRRLAFLDTLLDCSENGQKFSDASIREEVDTFMFEGHDTTSAGINWTIFLLGQNRFVQDKVCEELDSVFGDSDRPVTSSDLKELKYLECVIKESHRMYPPVPFFSRNLKEDVVVGEYIVPAGITVQINVFQLHRDPRYFPNPEIFDPDRFLPENVSKRPSYAYLPFSAGSRNCIGQRFAVMEEKVVLAHLLRRFRWISMDTQDNANLLAELILRPVDGIWIKMEKRQSYGITE